MNPYTDTSPEAEAVQLAIVRQMPSEQCVNMAIRMTNRLIRECKNAIRRERPELSEAEVGLVFIQLNYGDALYNAVKAHLAEVINDSR